MFAVGCSWFRATDMDDLYSATELLHGIHGGEIETGVMLHLHPDLIDMSAAEDFVPTSVEMAATGAMLTPEGRVGFGWQAQDLHASGACGNAAAADAERGGETVERAAAALVRLCREVAAYPLDRVTPATAYDRT
jgi:creatinine amidohydrolase